MHSARASASSMTSEATNPGAVTASATPWRAIAASSASRSGPSP